MKKLLGLIVCATLALMSVSPAWAASRTWYVDLSLNDGGRITGTFVYDQPNNTYSSVSLTSTTGTIRTGASYVSLNPAVTQTSQSLDVITAAGDGVGQPHLRLNFMPPGLQDAPGTFTPIVTEGGCQSPCSGFTTIRVLSSGSVTTTPPAIPTVGEWTMILLGLTLAIAAALQLQRQRRAIVFTDG